MSSPCCTLIAGPNGSGKSSLYEHFKIPGEFVNADEVAASLAPHLDGAARQVRAGRIIISRIAELIRTRADFTFETTLSSAHSLSVMRRAREAGFVVDLIYVMLDTPQRSVERI